MHQLWPIIGLITDVIVVNGISTRIRVPAPILLIVVGFAVSFIPGVPSFQIDPEVVLSILLPPLLYFTGVQSSLIAFRRLLRPILQLAVAAVIVTTLAVGFVVHLLVPSIPFAVALALGAVVSPPDAVAAIAIAKKVRLPSRIVNTLEGESLFNDATSLVMVKVATVAITAGSFDVGSAAFEFARASILGLLVGCALGFALSYARRILSNSLVTTSLSLIAPFFAYLIGESVEASGVLAVVVTGLIVGFTSANTVSAEVRLVERSTFSALQYVLEGGVFALIGLQLWGIITSVDAGVGTAITTVVTALVVVLVIRPIWIFFSYLITSAFGREGLPPRNVLAVVSWAGMRGVVSLAAAQTLPLSTPSRDLILLATMGVILGTLTLQGLSLPWFARKMNIAQTKPEDGEEEIRKARIAASSQTTSLVDRECSRLRVPDKARPMLTKWIALRHAETLQDTENAHLWLKYTDVFNHVRRDIIAGERETYRKMRNSGELSEEGFSQLEGDLDLEEAILIRKHSQRGQRSVLSMISAIEPDPRTPTELPGESRQ